MKNPKLIDEAELDAILEFFTKKEEHDVVNALRPIYSMLKPLPNPTKTNVDKIRAGEMAIENDYKDDMQKCLDYLVPSNQKEAEFIVNFYILINSKYWVASQDTDFPTIKASELIKEIEGVSEPEAEWQPKFGEVVEARDEDNEVWYERVFLFKHGSFFYCVADADKNLFYDLSDSMSITYWNQIRPKQTPTLTLAEAEAKLGVKIVI